MSDAVIDAVARALRLTNAEHSHLRHLSGGRRRPSPAAPRRERVRPALRDMPASSEQAPAHVSGRRWDLPAWNPAATALFGEWGRLPSRERNRARLVFLSPDLRRVFTDRGAVAVHTVGSLRLYAGRHPDDHRPAELVEELCNASAEFRRLWDRHDVKEHGHGARNLRHPLVGDLALSFESFRLPDDPDQCLTVYHAQPLSPAAAKLRLLIRGDAEVRSPGVR